MRKNICILFIVLIFISCKKYEAIPHGGNIGKYKLNCFVTDRITKKAIFQAKVTVERDGVGMEQLLTDHLGQVRFVFNKKFKTGTEFSVSVEATGYEVKRQNFTVDKKESYGDKLFIIVLEEE